MHIYGGYLNKKGTTRGKRIIIYVSGAEKEVKGESLKGEALLSFSGLNKNGLVYVYVRVKFSEGQLYIMLNQV